MLGVRTADLLRVHDPGARRPALPEHSGKPQGIQKVDAPPAAVDGVGGRRVNAVTLR